MVASTLVERGGPLALSTSAAKGARDAACVIAALEALCHPKSNAAPPEFRCCTPRVRCRAPKLKRCASYDSSTTGARVRGRVRKVFHRRAASKAQKPLTGNPFGG